MMAEIEPEEQAPPEEAKRAPPSPVAEQALTLGKRLLTQQAGTLIAPTIVGSLGLIIGAILLMIIIAFVAGYGGKGGTIPGQGTNPENQAEAQGHLNGTLYGRGAAGSPTTLPAGAGSLAAAIIQLAQAETGNCEQPLGSNTGPRIAIYKRGGRDRLPWCASFVSYVLQTAGAPIGHERAARGMMQYYIANQSKGFRWIPKNQGTPEPGDIYVQTRCGSNKGCNNGHIGIVTTVDAAAGTFTTIEGNVGKGCVLKKPHRISEGPILGFGRYVGT